MSSSIEVQREDAFERISLTRPPKNLLDPPTMDAMRAAMLEADAGEAPVIVISGVGDVFCAGLDLAEIAEGASPVDFAAALVELLRIFPTLSKPVIAAVNGDALASGYALACAADMAVAVEGSRLGTMETGNGIWPMIAQVPALQRIPPRIALENILTAEPFEVERARELGIVNRVTAAADLWAEVERLATTVARGGAAIAEGRRSFYRFLDLSYDDALTGSLDVFRRMFEEG